MHLPTSDAGMDNEEWAVEHKLISQADLEE